MKDKVDLTKGHKSCCEKTCGECLSREDVRNETKNMLDKHKGWGTPKIMK